MIWVLVVLLPLGKIVTNLNRAMEVALAEALKNEELAKDAESEAVLQAKVLADKAFDLRAAAYVKNEIAVTAARRATKIIELIA